MNDLYTELSEIMGTLEAYEMELGLLFLIRVGSSIITGLKIES